MKKSRYKKYWYGTVLTMLKHYDPKKKPSSFQEYTWDKAIKDALVETSFLKYGERRLIAIDLYYFKKTKKIAGIVDVVNFSERTIHQWLIDFVYLVAKNVGF